MKAMRKQRSKLLLYESYVSSHHFKIFKMASASAKSDRIASTLLSNCNWNHFCAKNQIIIYLHLLNGHINFNMCINCEHLLRSHAIAANMKSKILLTKYIIFKVFIQHDFSQLFGIQLIRNRDWILYATDLLMHSFKNFQLPIQIG